LHQAEVAVIGREGMTGIAAVLGVERPAHDTFVQIEGSGQCMSERDLRVVMGESKSVANIFRRYVHALNTQIVQTSVANAKARLEARLARWLLMAHDRSHDNTIRLTHELLSLMLGTRRAGVTIAMNGLDSTGLITHVRGAITIVDRDGLREVAGDYYGVAE